MSLMKFDVVCGDSSQHGTSFFQALVFMIQRYQNFVIPRLGDQSPFPTRIAEVVQELRLLVFLDLIRVPSADEKNQVVGGPIRALEVGRIGGSLGRNFFHYQALLVNLIDIFQPELDYVRERLSSAGFGDRAGR